MRRTMLFAAVALALSGIGSLAHAQDGSRPATHTVQPGENLFRIALRYGVTVEALMQSNGLTDADTLLSGQTLTVPGEAPPPLAPDSGSGTTDLGLIGVRMDFTPIRLPVDDLGILGAGSGPVTTPDISGMKQPDVVSPVSDAPEEAAAPDRDPVEPSTATALEPAPDERDTTAVISDQSPDTADLGILSSDEGAQEDSHAAPAPDTSSGDATTVTGEAANSPDLGIISPDTATWMLQPEIITAGGPNVRTIYLRGLQLGNNPHAFSKIGDCNSEAPFFLAKFDNGEYELGPYDYLQPVIDHFAGSFGRESISTWTGNHVWALFDSTWANPALCLPDETPIACEFRVNKPSVVLIRLGTNEAGSPDLFAQYMRQIIEFSIERGVVPILGTKADRLEGSDRNNDTVRQLAAEYEVPLWDFGRIVDTIPGRGLREDGFHMTWYPLTFDDPRALQAGHAVHNLSALMALDTVWRSAMH